MERRSAVVSLIVADRSHPTGLRSVADVTFIHFEKQMSCDADIDGVRSRMVFVFTTSSLHFFRFAIRISE
jgi:hypothetical protein